MDMSVSWLLKCSYVSGLSFMRENRVYTIEITTGMSSFSLKVKQTKAKK